MKKLQFRPRTAVHVGSRTWEGKAGDVMSGCDVGRQTRANVYLRGRTYAALNTYTPFGVYLCYYP